MFWWLVLLEGQFPEWLRHDAFGYNRGVETSGANDVYETRPGVNWRSAFIVAGCAIFCLVILTTPSSIVMEVLGLGLFGVGGLVYVVSLAYAMATRQVALRIDAAGVTMRPKALSSTVRFRPWSDVEALVIWQFRLNPYLGIVPRPGAAPLLDRPSGFLTRASTSYLAPNLPHETVATSIPAVTWTLRAEEMAEITRRVAPNVHVVDLRRRRGLATR